ncbi:hypothetical protein DJ568_13735 [Mucilaginibacter hurinus]|uniref:L,D-TPase catalytic domain-containing protein n=1 Tax=Mucilaginibacter hurinus TaxID=2201324 RepID=A0A367GNH2_9SPHI|nr:hypothetical protein DJ568_13735 [Mucilaginibacter hurinus]
MKKYRALAVCLFSLLFISWAIDDDFWLKQKSKARVQAAYKDKEELLTQKLSALGINLNAINILITGFKSEGQLTVYVKKPADIKYTRFAVYSICSSSGILGPKRKARDMQVPEGFYYINRFNPVSSYFLSLGINYPNEADKYRSRTANPGSDIFIHGKCVTEGCLPLTDDKIKELYILAIQAHHSGQQQIPVYIFPFRFDGIIGQRTMENYRDDKYLQSFWTNLKQGYDEFIANRQQLAVQVSTRGTYIFNR